jgi:hypothetical protein
MTLPQTLARPASSALVAAAAAAVLLLSLGAVDAFRTPSQWVAASRQQQRTRGRVGMEVNSAVSNAPLGQGPYKGPASNPLLDSVRYPHDMKQFSLKVRVGGGLFFVSVWFGGGSKIGAGGVNRPSIDRSIDVRT